MIIQKIDAIQDENSHKKRANSVRLQLVLPVESVNRLNAIKDLTEASSYAEVFRRALRIYEGLLAETQDGGDVLVRRPDGIEQRVPLGRAL